MNPVTQAKYVKVSFISLFRIHKKAESFNGEKKGWKTKNLYIKIKICNFLPYKLLGVMEERFQMSSV